MIHRLPKAQPWSLVEGLIRSPNGAIFSMIRRPVALHGWKFLADIRRTRRMVTWILVATNRV